MINRTTDFLCKLAIETVATEQEQEPAQSPAQEPNKAKTPTSSKPYSRIVKGNSLKVSKWMSGHKYQGSRTKKAAGPVALPSTNTFTNGLQTVADAAISGAQSAGGKALDIAKTMQDTAKANQRKLPFGLSLDAGPSIPPAAAPPAGPAPIAPPPSQSPQPVAAPQAATPTAPAAPPSQVAPNPAPGAAAEYSYATAPSGGPATGAPPKPAEPIFGKAIGSLVDGVKDKAKQIGGHFQQGAAQHSYGIAARAAVAGGATPQSVLAGGAAPLANAAAIADNGLVRHMSGLMQSQQHADMVVNHLAKGNYMDAALSFWDGLPQERKIAIGASLATLVASPLIGHATDSSLAGWGSAALGAGGLAYGLGGIPDFMGAFGNGSNKPQGTQPQFNTATADSSPAASTGQPGASPGSVDAEMASLHTKHPWLNQYASGGDPNVLEAAEARKALEDYVGSGKGGTPEQFQSLVQSLSPEAKARLNEQLQQRQQQTDYSWFAGDAVKQRMGQLQQWAQPQG